MSRKNQKTKRSRVAPPKKTKNRSFIGIFLGNLFKLFFIILLIFIILFCFRTYQNGWGVKGALMTAFMVSQDDIENLEPINIVLLGISEDLDSRLTDTIIVCSYNPKTTGVSMLSVPRDTFIGNSLESAKGSEKINALFSKNKEKFLNKISEITGIDVKYYAVINNDALIKIVDIIGGVNFEVPIDMDYDDPTQDLHIHLKKGMQLIDGEKAEQLLRFRHNNDGTSYPANYGDNDFGRMKTQRAFIEATVKQAITLKNGLKAKNIYNTILENVDTNYDVKDAKKYIPTLADFSFENIINNQLPGKSEKHNELWFFVYDSKKTKNLVTELGIK